jgi:acyl-coenzyme A synthetase/AMP-(fatty) acid ligase
LVTDPGSGFAQHLLKVFETRADHPYLVSGFDDRQLTYGEAFDRSRRIAGWMASEGIGAGDAVALSSPNDIDLALGYFAAMHLGARIVPLNPQLAESDRQSIIAVNRPKLVLADPDLADATAGMIAAAGVDTKLHGGTETLLPEASLQANPHARTFGDAADSDVFLTAYSSGSTAAPKGVDVTWTGMFGNGLAYARHMGLDENCRFYNTLPMTYMGGLYNMTMLPASIGATTISDHVLGPANLFAYWDQVDDLKADTLWFAAAILSMLMAADRGDDLSAVTSRVRFAFCGFAPLPQEVRERCQNRFGLQLLENFASSECLYVTAQKPGVDHPPLSKGPALEGITVDIIDGDGNILPQGQEGEVRIRSPHVCAGYRAGSEADAAAITPEGFLSGDLGHLDENGDLFITGRAKELIIRGGENISPASVEEALVAHPDVTAAAVAGLPDKVYGETVGAAVVLRAGAGEGVIEDIQRHCRANLPNARVPTKIMAIGDLPKGPTGKVDRKAVRAVLTGEKG